MEYPIAKKFRSGALKKPEVNTEEFMRDGNVFALLAHCRRALRRMPAAYNELWERVQQGDYDQALAAMMDYIELV